MRRVWTIFSLLLTVQAYSQTVIRADHTVVDQFEEIPARWLDVVKTKLVYIHGMSHAYGYLRGAELLDLMYDDAGTFRADIWFETSPPAATNTALRIGRPSLGSMSIVTSPSNRSHFESNTIENQNESGNPYDFVALGWSYWMVWTNSSANEDPEYNVHWWGTSQSGIDGDREWGLDADDYAETGNRFCAEYYLHQVDTINDYLEKNGWKTKMLVTTGIVDNDGGTEQGYQRELKNTYIRNSVGDTFLDTVYLFDYADILSWDYQSNSTYTVTWNDAGNNRTHAQISPENLMDYDENFNIVDPGSDAIEDHIGEVGAVRLAKAMWWLLARASGWDGTGEVSSASNHPETLSAVPEVYVHRDSNTVWIENADEFLSGQMKLYDIQGKLIEMQRIEDRRCHFHSDLESGLFVVVLSKGQEQLSKKVLL